MRRHYIDEIKSVLILSCAVILFLSLFSFVPEDLPWYASPPNKDVHNLISVFGAYLAGSLMFVFGYGSYFLVAFLIYWAWEVFYARPLKWSLSKMLCFFVFIGSTSSLLSMFGSQEQTARFVRSGIVGLTVSNFLTTYCGGPGAFIILMTLAILSVVLLGEFLLSPLVVTLFRQLKSTFIILWQKMHSGLSRLKERSNKPKPVVLARSTPAEKMKRVTQPADGKKADAGKQTPLKDFKKMPEARIPATPRITVTEKKPESSTVISQKERSVGDYKLPTLDLLKDPPGISARKMQGDLMNGAKTLENTLANFGVDARVADIERGPVITRFELEPAPGVKVQRITTLSDDIALAMQAQTVRIVAPIPGKNRVGIEVPNLSTSLVYLKEVLAQSQFQNSKDKIALALGKDISGKTLVADLADMPHLLIAGTTGAGKTVCLNSIIMSMLFRSAPHEVKFLFVDPKMVELSIYNKLPHALCPAVTDPKKVSAALNWVVGEMESRYNLLAEEGVRNIVEYNRIKDDKLPYIVVVVDELADLMQVAAKNIESAITRLAQLSRAVGIHLILATQRPSVNVITGVIKANFPARISFKVASKVDSRTVLDMNGAEALLGKGDMLFMKPGEAKPTRAQCTLVSDEEINDVIGFIKAQQGPQYNDDILKKQTKGSSGNVEDKDELYDEAVRLVVETNQASVSILQRRMRLGYTRAARLIDMMEQEGVVGPYAGSKPRELLVNREEWLMQNMSDRGSANG